MTTAELRSLGLRDLDRALSTGATSSSEVTDAYLARIDAVEPVLHACTAVLHDEARLAAVEADGRIARRERKGPLDGVPLSLKESLDLRGHASTLGMPSRANQIAADDAVMVRVLRAAGAVFLAKTNVSQALLFHESRNPLFGEAKNPWNLARGPGGSSGGEAALIAAGGSPAGVGTDVGGSIRGPAHVCGVVGLKPTNDRWSVVGSQTGQPGQETVRGQSGPMGRTVDDVRVLWEACAPAQIAALDPRVPPLPHGDSTGDVRGLRIGFFVDDAVVPVSAACRRAVERAVRALQDRGAVVFEAPPHDVHELVSVYLGAMSADGGVTLQSQIDDDDLDVALSMLWRLQKLPAAARRLAAFAMDKQGEPHVARLLRALGEKRVADTWALTRRARALAVDELVRWDRLALDALVCPPHATPALPHGASRDFALGGTLSMRFNLLNFPAGVVPVTRVRPDEQLRPNPRGRLERAAAAVDVGSAGLPVGVQVVARPWHEHVCLRVMGGIEDGVKHDDGFPALPPPFPPDR
ncbi:MAG: amidase [Deltaproteobacteria bacterium]|nr:amidase [Deltaproteobacteria bacterium]